LRLLLAAARIMGRVCSKAGRPRKLRPTLDFRGCPRWFAPRMPRCTIGGAGSMGDRQAPLGTGAAFGHFERLSLLGEGSHGVVWLARQSEPRRTVALKILHGSLASGDLLARFRREVELLAMLEHPGIARLYESGDRKSTRLNSSHVKISYAVFC